MPGEPENHFYHRRLLPNPFRRQTANSRSIWLSLTLALCAACLSAMGAADLGLRSTWPAPASYPLGRGFVITFSVTNAGPDTASGVWVTNELPAILRLRHEQPVPGPRGYVSSAVRCGPTRVAFVDTAAGQIYIVNSEYLTDLDRDGLPDAWEREHFISTTHPDASASVDADHDGLSNLDEYLAGTDPKDGASVLRLSCRGAGQGTVQLEFPTVVGRCYQVQRAEDLANGPWITVEELSGTGNASVVADGAAPPSSRQFYRLKVWQ